LLLGFRFMFFSSNELAGCIKAAAAIRTQPRLTNCQRVQSRFFLPSFLIPLHLTSNSHKYAG
jgi:hypothetical protein